jgi:hypothetical protein
MTCIGKGETNIENLRTDDGEAVRRSMISLVRRSILILSVNAAIAAVEKRKAAVLGCSR